jgi:head-tail adaptor
MSLNTLLRPSKRSGIGTRPHKVTVQNPGPSVPDGDGGYTQTPVVSAEPWWVSIVAATFRDLQNTQAGTVLATKVHIVRGPYRADLSTQSQIVFVDLNGTTRTFDVNGIDNIELQNFELVLSCTEVEQPTMPAKTVAAAPALAGHTVEP